ncbi:cell division protein ZapE [Salinisphaera sp. Q1T1-3]|uniref:cell division protein ZapE n=1 Tax=Salinisphaera sp. Q1T1-3 TaxID=2321229 RepID=UPI000E7269C0|nr:cell division protein ZapE [Salinisphaera sp. Q1T1-3]RJS92350.1 AFG1 family ATPase [Salinisphaera sp. Q1T1-3]
MSRPTPLSPQQRYEADLERADFARDPAQAEAVAALEDIHQALVAQRTTSHGLFGRRKKREPVAGLYLWGGVGRGKTYLMDCFFDSLPFEDKTRLHFHRFMAKVHAARKRYANQQDPLVKIAEEWAADRVLCFDEFFVSDIADAMILSRLTGALFERGVTLVATSNVDPDDLYSDGLKRENFLPAIERIKTHCRVMHLADGTDYRLDHIEESDTYQTPSGPEADARLGESFDRLAAGRVVHAGNVEITGRKIATRYRADNAVWFDFDALCRSARSAGDYIEIAREYPVVMISDIPILTDRDENAARRFINAVDEFYDRRVNLFVSADAGPDDLYAGTALTFEFERTASRLHEMSTAEYIGTAHRH